MVFNKRRLTQKEIELHYFEQFKAVYALPAGEIVHHDRPDVVIEGSRKLGIEITHFYKEDGARSGSEQIQSRRRESVVCEAQKLYFLNGGKNIEFRFGFNKAHPIKDIRDVAGRIAALVPSLEHRQNGQIPRSAYAHIPELNFMYLYARTLQYSDEPVLGFPDGEPDGTLDLRAWMEYRNRREARALKAWRYEPLSFRAEWGVMQAHSFGKMSTERLEEILRSKEDRAREYATCDALWLLVLVDFIDPAQEQEIRIDGIDLTSQVFQRVIVYKPRFEHIVDIVCQPSPRASLHGSSR